MTKLEDLNPRWVGAGGEGVTWVDTGEPVPRRKKVGVSFDCPCGRCGSRVFIMFQNPVDGGAPFTDKTPKWDRTGDDFETMTLRPSILRKRGCDWHGFLTDGVFRSC